VAAVERQPAAGTVHREHPGRRRGRRDVKEAAGAVLGFEPLPAVHPDARTALDPVGGRARDAEHLRHRGGEQFAGPGRHHTAAGPRAAAGADHVDRAGAQIDDEGVVAGSRRGEGAEPGRGRLADRPANGHVKQVRQGGGGLLITRSAQRGDQHGPAGAALPRGGRLGSRGQVHREQVIDIGFAGHGPERPYRSGRPAGQPGARDPQREAALAGHHHPWLAPVGPGRHLVRGGWQQAHHGVGVIGQRQAHRGRVARLAAGQAEARTERHRVSQQVQRVPGRTYLDREQLARGRRAGVDLVDDRQPGRQPVGYQHALVAGHQDGADPRPGRQQRPQPGGGLVVAQAGRDHRDHCRVAWPGIGERDGIGEGKRHPDAGADPAWGGYARGQHAQPAGRRGCVGHGHHRGFHRAQRRDPGLADRAAQLPFQPADQRSRAAQRAG
jgi:hypothetical protein